MATLNSNALTTVSRLADYMGIDTPTASSSLENQLIAYINAISNYIERYVGMPFKSTTYTQEEYTVERGQTINLKHYPIVSASPFLLERRNSNLNEGSWETVDSTYYTVDTTAGIVNAMASIFFFRGQNLYRITYTAGYDFDNSTTFLSDTEAGEVELALWLIAQDFYTNKGQDMNIKSEKLGDYSVSYGQVQGTMFSNPQGLSILDHWRGIMMDSPLTPLQSF